MPQLGEQSPVDVGHRPGWCGGGWGRRSVGKSLSVGPHIRGQGRRSRAARADLIFAATVRTPRAAASMDRWCAGGSGWSGSPGRAAGARPAQSGAPRARASPGRPSRPSGAAVPRVARRDGIRQPDPLPKRSSKEYTRNAASDSSAPITQSGTSAKRCSSTSSEPGSAKSVESENAGEGSVDMRHRRRA